MKYLEWNNKIAERFFNSEQADKEVFLAVTREIIEEIASDNNTTFENFITEMKEGHNIKPPNQRDKICVVALDTFETWKKQKMKYPICIAHLALFVLAVTHGDSDDFSANNYYGRLRDLLKEEPRTGTYPSFEKMFELWDYLEKWSMEEKNGELGEFHCNIFGQHLHVGLPIAQIILTEQDRDNLPKIFDEMNWDCDSSPTDAEIDAALHEQRDKLSPRTKKKIEGGGPEFMAVLRQRVRDELIVFDDFDVGEEKNIGLRGQVVLCADIDERTEEVKFYFRAKYRQGLPDEEFILDGKHQVNESNGGFSERIDNLLIDWRKSKLFASDAGCDFHFRGSDCFVFSEQRDLQGLISGQRVVPNERFHLMVHRDLCQKTKLWGNKSCDEFVELDSYDGMATGWHLFRITGINADCQFIPALTLDKDVRLELTGGIRLAKGNKFFDFAPPDIFVANSQGEVICEADGQQVNLEQAENNSYRLPDNSPKNMWLQLKTKNNGKLLARKKLMLMEVQLDKDYDEIPQKAGSKKFARLSDKTKRGRKRWQLT